jgi:signal peptidase II
MESSVIMLDQKQESESIIDLKNLPEHLLDKGKLNSQRDDAYVKTLSKTPTWIWWAVLGVIIIDQLSKQWVLKSMVPGVPIVLLKGGLSLVLTFNTGAAFSFLASSGGWQRYAFAGIAVLTSMWLIAELLKPAPWFQRCGMLLILGGALGNLIDRLLYGHVVDFIYVYAGKIWSFSVFNVADMAITGGVMLLIYCFWKVEH